MTITEIAMLVTGWALGIQTMLIVQAVQMHLDDRREARRLAELRAASSPPAAAEAVQQGVDRFRAALHDGGHLPKEGA